MLFPKVEEAPAHLLAFKTEKLSSWLVSRQVEKS